MSGYCGHPIEGYEMEIRYPVGKPSVPRVRNERDDVTLIQILLNLMISTSNKLDIDGLVGKETIDAIVWFQYEYVRMPDPDGVVDPNGETLAELSHRTQDMKFYTAWSGVEMDSFLEGNTNRLAKDFYFKSGVRFREPIRITLTSGIRSSDSQANAMYKKFRGGGDYRLYKDRIAAKEIYDSYLAGIDRGLGESEIIDEMRIAIEEQMFRGVFISKHLTNLAVDVRSRILTAAQQNLFMAVARRHVESIILEKKPPHFHLQFA